MPAQPIEDEPANPETPALKLYGRIPPTGEVSRGPFGQIQRMDEDSGTALNRLGVYQIEAALGQGGMGEVFLGWDERLNRHVAIKRIRTDKPLDEVHHARFRREARAVARVSHPAIVQVYDVFESADGSECIVMEHVDGKSLAELLKRRAVDPELALRLATEVADGLAEAHSKGLVHRDLKAENVMVTSSGHAKILDFGLARALWPAVPGEDDARLSDSGALIGTAHAMSPEQAGGQSVDHRSDLFALGSLLYEMLTGRAPFRGTNLLDSLRRVISVDAEPLAALRPDLPAELAGLVERLLAKDPGKRPQNARMVSDELQQIRARMTLQGEGSEVRGGDLASLPTLAGKPRPLHVETYGAVSDGSVIVRTLVMTDLVRSTQLIESLGDERAFQISGHHDRIARDLLKKLGGLEIDKSDGFLLLFERPADAVAYALAYHRSLVRLSEEEGVELSARVGIHLGEIRLRHNPPEDVARGAKPVEVEGIAKPMAARVMSLAGPRQTLLTRAAFDLARRVDAAGELAGADLRWLAHGAYAFRGVEESIEIFEVGREGLSLLAEPRDTDKVRRVVSIQDELVLGWRPAAGQGIPRRKSWVLLEKIGQGGFGEVWLAQHKSGEKRVFKFCFEANRLRGLKREVTLFRLLKEALGHREDIARILDWNFEVAPFYLEAEYTEDGNLADWVEQQGGADQIPLATRLSLVADVAEALAAAHSVGVLHKDVKPENVLVTHDHDGRARAQLTDFGIGLLTDPGRLSSGGVTVMGFTATSSTLGSSEGGTLGYMAPEVMQGRPATVQADIYSLGVMLYQMAVGDFGRALATGWRRDVEDEILTEDIAACVDGVAARRPASALEVAERLRKLEERHSARTARRLAQEEAERARIVLERARRRRRILLSTATIASVVLILVTALAIQATSARRQAELRKEQSEEFLGFMLGDLQKDIRSAGRLDILEEIGNRALKYFESVPQQELSVNEIVVQHQAFSLLGSIRRHQGNLGAARADFEQALQMAHELVRREPEKLEWKKDLGDAYFWVGFISWRQNDLDRALEKFDSFREIAESLVAAEPENPAWRQQLVYATSNIGSVLQEKGDLLGALNNFSDCLQSSLALAALDPNREDWQGDLATSYNVVGESLRAQGEPVAALDHHESELEINRALAEKDPGDTTRQENLADSHRFVGMILADMGDDSGGLENFTRSIEILERLTRIEPNRLSWQRNLARSHSMVGLILKRQGHPGEALERFRLSKEILQGVAAAAPVDVRYQRDFAESRILLGQAYLANGDVGTALREGRLAVEATGELLTNKPDDRTTRRLEALGRMLLGDVLRADGDLTRAHDEWLKALEYLEPLAKESGDIRLLGPWSQILTRLERPEEATSIVNKLKAMGYHRSEFG